MGGALAPGCGERVLDLPPIAAPLGVKVLQRPLQALDGGLQAGGHLPELPDGAVDLPGGDGAEVSRPAAPHRKATPPEKIHLPPQLIPADLQPPGQLRPGLLPPAAPAVPLQIVPYRISSRMMSSSVVRGPEAEKEGARHPLSGTGPLFLSLLLWLEWFFYDMAMPCSCACSWV